MSVENALENEQPTPWCWIRCRPSAVVLAPFTRREILGQVEMSRHEPDTCTYHTTPTKNCCYIVTESASNANIVT